ncbi:MAG TPA: S8 family serine peptidase, partial [Actinomycetota bacterium]|nr:S8 family serine peptidase [Actinomycetota bacterium]
MQRRFWAGSVCAALFLSVLVTLPAPAFGSGNPAGNDISAPSSGAAASNPATGSELRRLVVRDGSAQVIVGLDTAFVPEGRLTRSRTGQQRDGIERAGDALFERLSGTRYEKIREFETIPYVVVDVSARALAALERSPGVTSIVEDAVMAPTLATSTKIVEVPQMGNIGYTGDGKVVAVLDTGVESTHTFLTGKVVEEACFSSGSDCPNGLTTQVGAGSAAPCTYSNLCNHGTHVAGIAAGAGPTSTGVAKDADVMAVQVFSQFTGASCGSTPSPCPLSTSSDQIAALQRVYQLRSTHSFAA